MIMSESLRGKRGITKTYIGLPNDFKDGVDIICEQLGISKSAFCSLAVGYMVVKLGPLMRGFPKRKLILRRMQKLVQDAFDEALKLL